MSTQRFASVDILRGLAITIMIICDGFPDGDHIYAQLTHCAWDGIHLADTAFPTFLFLVGVSAAFSRTIPGNTGWLKRIINRSLYLFLLGILINQAFGIAGWLFQPDITLSLLISNILQHGRPLGVLQRIAMAYLLGMLLIRLLPHTKHQLTAVLALLLFSSAGYHIYYPAAPFDPDMCISSAIDKIFPGTPHCYMQKCFDPEGLYGLLNSTATMLLGYMTGSYIHNSNSHSNLIKHLMAYGLILLLAGTIWSFFDLISKPLWTSPYVLLMAGIDVLLISILEGLLTSSTSLLSYILHPLQALGQNPIFFYLLNDSLLVLLISIPFAQSSFYDWLWHSTLYPADVQLIGPYALLFCFIMVAIHLFIAELLYHRHIIIKL